jgi:hypothetical protein
MRDEEAWSVLEQAWSCLVERVRDATRRSEGAAREGDSEESGVSPVPCNSHRGVEANSALPVARFVKMGRAAGGRKESRRRDRSWGPTPSR